jgi:hypothetical protein
MMYRQASSKGFEVDLHRKPLGLCAMYPMKPLANYSKMFSDCIPDGSEISWSEEPASRRNACPYLLEVRSTISYGG